MDLELLKSLKQLQEKLNTTSGNLEKQKILKKYSTEKIKQLFQLIFDNNVNFNVTSLMVNKISFQSFQEYNLFDLLDNLSNRNITGHNAVYAVQNYIKQYPEYENQILNIIDKDLKIGMNVKQINKVFSDLIPTFSVALAENFDNKTKDKIKIGKWFISRKLDGVRCICIIKNNKIQCFSRQGKEFLTLDKLKEEVEKLNLNNIVLDGEIAIVQNGKEDFTAVMKEIRRKDHTISNPKYFIFDILTLEEFETQKSKRNLSKRLFEDAPKLDISFEILEYLPQHQYTLEKFGEMQREVDKYGWEGLMLRKDTVYQGKRSKDILKVKKFYDDEFRVKSIETNTIRQYDSSINNYVQVETLGAVVIDYKGYDVSVGSGFTMEERNEIYKNPEKIVGKLITVQYFEEIKDKKGNLSLRFPTFKTIVGDKREM